MLGNAHAPAIVPAIERLGRSGIRLHTQIVLCPGINDGTVLDRTLEELSLLGDTVESIAVVPVGLTSHRDGLQELSPVGRSDAVAALRTVARRQEENRAAGRDRTIFAADELYLLADAPLPDYEDYGDFPQLENGVGLLRMFEAGARECAARLRSGFPAPISGVVITGSLAAGFIETTLGTIFGGVPGLTLRVRATGNSVLGPSVTVAGLLSGVDLAGAAQSEADADLLLLPPAAFNEDGVTLDGMTIIEIAEAVGRKTSELAATEDIAEAILTFAARIGRSAEPGLGNTSSTSPLNRRSAREGKDGRNG
jgi:NifB/MoaA-like Fe-S oxidoreductase